MGVHVVCFVGRSHGGAAVQAQSLLRTHNSRRGGFLPWLVYSIHVRRVRDICVRNLLHLADRDVGRGREVWLALF